MTEPSGFGRWQCACGLYGPAQSELASDVQRALALEELDEVMQGGAALDHLGAEAAA